MKIFNNKENNIKKEKSKHVFAYAKAGYICLRNIAAGSAGGYIAKKRVFVV